MKRALTRLCVAALLVCGVAPAQVEDEEFTGPFPSWSVFRRDSGNVTQALQRALSEVGTPGHSSNLFIPAGAYCVESLSIVSRLGVTVVGADPANTILKYCGKPGGALLNLNGLAYSKISRLTFDCAGVAALAVEQAWDNKRNHFDTGNEYSDVVFRNCPTAIRGGNLGYGFAETSVLRARFGPSAGPCVILKNFNALDLWIWDSLFDRCETGVTNDPGAGNFSIYNSVFRNSAVADAAIHNTGGFSLRNNTSIGSKAFWVTSSRFPYTALNFPYPALTTLQGNRLIGVAQPAVVVRNQGPLLFIDNEVQSPSGASRVAVSADAMQDTDVLSVGNVFTQPKQVAARGRFIQMDDRAVPLKLQVPVLPGTPRDLHRMVFEVPKGGGSAEIQKVIDTASKAGAPRAVVHLPEGDYRIEATLEIPRGSDLQVTGDGYTVTRLVWSGAGPGPVIHAAGPSKAIFREIAVSGSEVATGILVDGVDQPGARVYLQQAQWSSTTVAGLFVDRLDHALVDLRNVGHKATGPGPAVKVLGGPLAAAGRSGGGRTDLFSGASSNNALSYELSQGGQLLVRDMWYEGVGPSTYARLTGSGTFTSHGPRVAMPQLGKPPGADIVDFHGSASFLANLFDDRIVTSGDGAGSRVLALGVVGGVKLGNFLLNNSVPPAEAAVLNSRDAVAGGSSLPVPDHGTANPAFLRAMLAQTRAEQPGPIGMLPDGVSDVRFYRISVERATVGIRLKP